MLFFDCYFFFCPLTQVFIGICKSTNFDSSNQNKVALEQCPYFEKPIFTFGVSFLLK